MGVFESVTGVGVNVGVVTGDTGLTGTGTRVAVEGISVAEGWGGAVNVGEGDIVG